MSEMQGYGALIKRLNAVGSTQAASKLMGKIALAAVREQKLLVPRKTGNLGRTIHVGAVTATTAQTVASANYAAYVEYGTGLYGPYHHRIVPVHAKALRWAVGQGGAGGPELRLTGSRRTRKGQALGAWAFARSVKGAHAQPYMVPGARRAIEASPLKDSVGASLISAWNDAA